MSMPCRRSFCQIEYIDFTRPFTSPAISLSRSFLAIVSFTRSTSWPDRAIRSLTDFSSSSDSRGWR